MEATRVARCVCGNFQVTCTGEPIRVSICHCNACQQRTGSAFGAQVKWPKNVTTKTGQTKQYTRTADSGGKVTYDFCPLCGTTICWEITGLDGFLIVALGCFGSNVTLPDPVYSVYEERAHVWALKGVPDGAEHIA